MVTSIIIRPNNRNSTVFVMVKLLPYLIDSLGLHAVFIFHGLSDLLSFIIILTCIWY